MKKFVVIITCLICLPFTATVHAKDGNRTEQQTWANYNRYEPSNASLRGKPVKAVFMGNSITEGWYATDSAFFKKNGYIGRGISGQVTAQMLARFQSDVISLHPKVVVILAGTNDLAQNGGYMPVEKIFENIVSMTELAMYHHIRPVVCSLLPAYEYPWRKEIGSQSEKIKSLNRMIFEYAKKKNLLYVNYFDAMVDNRDGLPTKLSSDGVHPNAAGFKIMEPIVVKAINKAIRK